MALDTLPRGPHRLSRDAVAESQRTRLLEAAIELGAEHGFPNITLGDIVGRAGVARRTFYVFFPNKEACCIAALDHAGDEIAQTLLAIHQPEADLRTRLDINVGALLDLAVRRPALIRMLTSDAGSAGPAASTHQRAMRARIADSVIGLSIASAAHHPSITPPSRTRALAIVGAVNEVIQQTFHAEGPSGLPALRGELVEIIFALIRPRPAAR